MKKRRDFIRILHLVGAVAIGIFVYSPYAELAWFKLSMQIIVIPSLSLTGLWLWKPKWFKRIAKRHVILILGMLSTHSINALQAQDKIKGGSGGVMIGIKAYETSAFQYFILENGLQIDDNLIQIGGEGYGIINHFILGGNGYYSGGDKVIANNESYQLQGGSGFLHLGYVVYHTDELLAFPLIGFGANALGINRIVDEDITYEPGVLLEANYFMLRPSLDLGSGLDWFPGKKGFKLGVRLGYNLSLGTDKEWRHEGGKIINNDLPANNLDGFYLRLTIGGGHFVVR